MSISDILTIVKQNNIDAIHPGYGFLSESEEFAKQALEVGAFVVGPGPLILGKTGDKLMARGLAEECM